ncbi:MAG: sensor histidine kinase [Brachybacterium tyrofermentans]|uniref:Sensor histidine kinase n=1 Tax=Brachybacterium tyrofermentans TaxID=47848 RepID=A0ABW0FEH2_9MICO|nr:histidine kinase [Brachybacterium tyrofermentans]SLN02875.1 two-component system sensor kinase [Corynebacterium xerosis]
MDTSAGRQWSVFYAYTAWTLVGVVALLPLGIALFLDLRIPVAAASAPLTVAVLCGQIALGAWSAWRAMEAWAAADAHSERDRWGIRQVGNLPSDLSFLAAVAPSAVIAGTSLLGDADPRLLIMSLSLVITTAAVRWRWEIGVGLAVAFAAVSALLLGSLPGALSSGLLVIAAVLTARLSLWLAAMVRELDDAREALAQLAVAEERLRFARDLHDVTGRDLSVIAVKSELVAQLAEREDPRAVEHGREVAQIARASLTEIRALVRGYREVDLATELRGTASLLRSAQAEVTVYGASEDVPARHRGTAAWVLREGGTNVLRHADPSAVTITLTSGGVTLVNDGAPGDSEVIEGSGLIGMRERLGAGSMLTIRREGGIFTLDVRFDAPGGTR